MAPIQYTPRGLVVVFLIASLFASLSYSGDIKKWVDADGNTHYGNVPPSGSSAETVKIHKPPPRPTTPVYKVDKISSAERDRIELKAAEQARRQKSNDKIDQARKKYRAIQSKYYDPEKCKEATVKAKLIKEINLGYLGDINYNEYLQLTKLYCHK